MNEWEMDLMAKNDDEKKALDQEIGARIRLARKAAGLTQERLAELVDINPQHMSDIERGKRGTSVISLRRFSIVLHVTSDYLLFGSNETNHIAFVERMKTLNEAEQDMIERASNLILEAMVVAAKAAKKDD